jgi:hypothetical protein
MNGPLLQIKIGAFRRYESKIGSVAQPLLAVRLSPIAVAMAKTRTAKSTCATEAEIPTLSYNLDNSMAFHESPLIFNFLGIGPIDF